MRKLIALAVSLVSFIISATVTYTIISERFGAVFRYLGKLDFRGHIRTIQVMWVENPIQVVIIAVLIFVGFSAFRKIFR